MTHRIAKAQFYQTDEDGVRLVQQFEACTLPRTNWNQLLLCGMSVRSLRQKQL